MLAVFGSKWQFLMCYYGSVQRSDEGDLVWSLFCPGAGKLINGIPPFSIPPSVMAEGFMRSNRHSTSKVDWFYGTRDWRKCSLDYLRSQQYLCERCRNRGEIVPAEIVHHIVHLTPANVHDANVSLNWSNLMAVCRKCHGELHGKNDLSRRYIVTNDGRCHSVTL